MPEKEIQSEEPPKELTPDNVVFWSDHWKKLVVEGGESAKGVKAKLLVKNNCFTYVKKDESLDGKGHYIVSPIPGNHATHKIYSVNGEFECSCQEFQTYKRTCSHILGLFLQLKIWNWNKKNGIPTT